MVSSKSGLKAIATLEASKGLLALFVALGLHLLMGDDLQHMAESLVTRAHLNPASEFPSVFIHAASSFSDINMNLLALGAFGYSLVRFIEAYGLWKEFVWVEWFALLSGAIYLPFEIYEMIYRPSVLGAMVFAINLVVVAYMTRVLMVRKRIKQVAERG